MQALNNFISPIPSFNGDIPFLAAPVSARPSGDESIGDLSARASASASKTRVGKQKATVTRLLRKRLRKLWGNLQARSKSMNLHRRS
jgi:hypothetical protein